MKRLILFLLVLVSPVAAQAAVTQLNALSWAKADGSNQTTNMQRAVNAAATAGQSLFVPPGIVYNAALLTNTANVLIEDYTDLGSKTLRGALEVVSAPSVAITNYFGSTNVTQLADGDFYGRDFFDKSNVRWWGAKGDGVADDTVAVRRWLTNSNGGVFYAPPGIYKLTASVPLPRYGIISGAGVRANEGTNGTTFVFSGGHGFTHVYVGADHEFDHTIVRDMVLVGDGTGTGIAWQNSHQFETDNIRIHNFDIGMSISNCWDIIVKNTQCSGNETAGLKLCDLVTDLTCVNPQLSNNDGYGLWIDTDSSHDIQTLRVFGGSMQYNKLGNWLNGGIELTFIGTHFEGNAGPDLLIGSATNQCESVELSNVHHDWSSNQYTYCTNTWGVGTAVARYQIQLENVDGFTTTGWHANAADIPAKNRYCIYASPECRNLKLNGISGYLSPYYFGYVRPMPTNPNRNLIPNGLMIRDERNPNNYPYGWISDILTNQGFSSLTLTNYVGYTFGGVLSNSWSLYITNEFALKTNTVYTHTSLIDGDVNSRALIRLVDRQQWNGGSNDVSQTANVITNNGTQAWIVSRYIVPDQYHTNPYLFTTLYSSGTNSLRIGDCSFVEGYGVGGASQVDEYEAGSNSKFKLLSSDIPNQGTWVEGDVVWNSFTLSSGVPISSNVVGWVCTVAGTPGTWIPFGGMNVLGNHTNSYTLGKFSVGTTNNGNNLNVYSASTYGGIDLDGSHTPLLTLKTNGTASGYLGTVTTAGEIFSDAQPGDVVLRSQNNRIVFGGSGGGASYLSISNNLITFGATNTAPVGAVTPTKWISVQVNGEATAYRIPLYE